MDASYRAEEAVVMRGELDAGRPASMFLSRRAVALLDPFVARWRDLFVEGRLDRWAGDPRRPEGYLPALEMRHSFCIQRETTVPVAVQLVTAALIGELTTTAEEALQPLLAPLGLAARGVHGMLRVAYYPPTAGANAPAWTSRPARAGKLRASPHTDLDLITLLPGVPAPGLQFADELGWCEAPGIRGSTMVLAGSELARVSRGRIPATLHRVRNPKPGEDPTRMSIAFEVAATLVNVDGAT